MKESAGFCVDSEVCGGEVGPCCVPALRMFCSPPIVLIATAYGRL
jgi:hypothetical protein